VRPGWRVSVALRSASCALLLMLLVAGSGSARTARLSEGSHEAAYPAGLGDRGLSKAPVVRRLAAARVRCSASFARVGTSTVSYAALVKEATVVRAAPQGRAQVVVSLGRVNVNGFRQVLGVIGVRTGARCLPDWYRVQLSVLPNGTTGWVHAAAVQTYRVRSRIVVDISQRRLRVYRSGKLALETPVAVGAPATPTPLGRFFVNERYTLSDASGPFGPNALGISAHSKALEHIWVENGPVGIHGTNQPWSIGRAASHGCIRVANDVMRRLFQLTSAGTPVVVRD
jgi:lipoprotein-anchoring transpeptidase ErfK/SrfK